MKLITSYISIFIFCLAFSSSFAQGKLDKLKLERYTQQYIGNYKEALKISENIVKLIDKKYQPKVFTYQKSLELANQAELVRLLGKNEIEINAKGAFAYSIASGTFGKNSWEAAHTKITYLSSLIKYGNLKTIEDELNEIFEIAKNEKWDNTKVNEIKKCKIEYNLSVGNYLEALKLHEEIADQQKTKIVTTVDVTHPKKGTIKTKKLKKPFYAILQRNYSEFLQLKAKILLLRGDYNTALEVLDDAQKWIEENIGKNDISYLINKHITGLTYNALKMEDIAIKHFEYTDKKQGVVAFNLKPEPTNDFIIANNIELAKYWINESPTSGVGQATFLRTKKKLTSAFKGTLREPITRLYKSLPYFYEHDYFEAIEVYEKTKAAYYDVIKDSPLAINFLENGYLFYTSVGKTKEALLILKELEKLYNTYYPISCPKKDLFAAKKGIFNSQYSNDFDLSLTLLQGVLNSSLSDQLHIQSNDYLNILESLSISQEYVEDYTEGISTLKKALVSSKLYSKINTPHQLEAYYNIKIASKYFKMGYIDDFLEYYDEANKLLEQIKDRDKKESIYRTQYLVLDANYQLMKGNLNLAEKSLEKAYKITHKELKKFKNDPNSHGEFEELITLDIKKGDYSKAEDKIFTSLQQKESIYGKDSRRLINTLTQLTELYLVRGAFADASKVINKNLEIADINYGKNSLSYSKILKSKGELLNDLGDYQGAINTFDKALSIYYNTFPEEHILIAKLLSSKGLAMMHSNKFTPTETYDILIKASKMIESSLRTRNTPAFSESIQNLALFNIKNNQLDNAEKMLDLATTIWENLPGVNKINRHIAAILILEGDIHKSRGEYDLAKEKYNKGKNYYENIFDDSHPSYIYALSKLSKVYFIQDDERNLRLSIDEIAEHHITFINEYFPSLSERDKTKYWQIINTDFEFYNNIAFKYKDEKYIKNAYNYALITKALLLNSSIKIRKNILQSNDSTLIANFNLYTQKKEELASILSKSTEELKKQGIEKDQLIKEINELEVQLSEQSDYFNNSKKKNKLIEWNDIQKQLNENEYAVEIIRYRKFTTSFTDDVEYQGLLVSSETKKSPQTINFKDGNNLENKHIHYYKNSTRFKSFDKESYKHFWKPIHKKVGDKSTVFLSADGVFTQVNLEALAINKKEYVIDKNNIILLNNTKSIIEYKNNQIETDSTNKHICLVGNPNFYKANESNTKHTNIDFNQPIKQLLGTEKEVELIKTILNKNNWKTKSYIFNNATEESIKQISNPKVLHIATHGFFLDHKKNNDIDNDIDIERALENPLLQSGVLLKNAGDIIENLDPHDYNTEDGILTAYEAMNMNLDQTEIVVLSACETGLGKVHNGEGVYGLQRAFLVAGSKSVIMSLFKVDDKVTQELMVAFYKHWGQSNNKRQAFTKAKQEIRKTYPSPIYWGAFIMIGI